MSREIDERTIACPGSMTFGDEVIAGQRLTVQAKKTRRDGLVYGALHTNHDTHHLLSAADLRLLSAWALSAAEWIEKQDSTDADQTHRSGV